MVGLSLLPIILGGLALSFNSPKVKSYDHADSTYRTHLITEENERGKYTVTGIADGYLDKDTNRIYSFNDNQIDEIADTAFSGTSFSTITFSKDITHINNAVFENAPNITKILFTGSQEEFEALNLSFNISNVSFYQVDEGFINYWNTNIRPSENTNICDITREKFSTVYGLYNHLIKSDLDIVNNYVDLANAKISDSMKELINVFSESGSQTKKDEWNQTGAITLIIIIAVIGMTSITVFFLLKTKNIIH